MKPNSIIQNLFSITWLAALRRTVEQWLHKYWFYLSRFLGTSEDISYFLTDIDVVDPRQDMVLYCYIKKAITDHTGLSGFVRVDGSGCAELDKSVRLMKQPEPVRPRVYQLAGSPTDGTLSCRD